MTQQGAGHTIAQLADALQGELIGAGDVLITGVNALDRAEANEITFVGDEAHARRWGESRAAAVVWGRRIGRRPQAERGRPLIIVDDAELASITLLNTFAPPPPLPETGVHPTAWVHPEARLGTDVRIGPHVSIDARTVVGDRTVLHAGARIYSDASVGVDCVIHANTVVRERCRVGNRVIMHGNVSIGGDGFGYRPDPAGRGLLKMPHNGFVDIGDDVEIGSGSCIDRGKFGPTTIGAGTKIDNLVQIAHNVRVGRCCVIAAHSALAGSVTLGDGVMMGGRSSVTEQVTIGPGARVGAGSGVIKDVEAGCSVLGIPADEAARTLRQWASIRKLPGLLQTRSSPAGGPAK